MQEMTISDFNLQKINTKEYETHLACSIDIGNNIIILGRRGSAKTAISKQVINSKNMCELYINLSIFERADLMGYCSLFTNDKFVDYRLPRIFQPLLEGNKKVVILFDEADKAASELHAPLLEILQMKTINGRILPNLQCCILTGNLISEGAGNKLISPLLDRAEKYLLEVNPNIWLKWASENSIHPSIYTFIYDNPNMLVGQIESDDNYADVSPRSWTLASNTITFGEQNSWTKNIVLEKIAGFVGKTAATQYETYYSHYKTLVPMVDKVFKGENVKSEYAKLEPSDQLMASIMVGAKFANKLDQLNPKDEKDKKADVIKHIGKFMNYAGEENVVAVVRGQITGKRLTTWLLHLNEHWQILNDIRKESYGDIN